MAKNWTDAQKEAIYLRDRGVLVSAAAGSGKTSVLTERVVSLLKEGKDISRMLIVTFTNAAAAEMRSRIKLRLSEELAANSDDKHLRRQILLLPSAQISTMHAFCLNLIREHYNKTGVSPNAKIGDEGEIASLKYEAAVSVVRDFVRDEELFRMINPGKTDERIIQNIIKIYDYISSYAFMNETLSSLESLCNPEIPFKESIYYPILKEKALLDVSYYIESLENIKAAAGEISFELLSELERTADQDIAYLQTLKELLEDDEYDSFREALYLGFARLLPIKSSENIKERFKSLRDNIKTGIKKLQDIFSYSAEEYREDMERIYPAGKLFFDMVREFQNTYGEMKKEKELLDFSDIEHLTIKLLYSEEGVVSDFAKALAEEFDEIMVDEFQDTNETQYAVFRALSDNEQNLFTVGDVKQSIYRFRLADPTIFLKRKERCSAAAPDPYLIALSDNFRSSKGVCNTVNKIFSSIMSPTVGEMYYGEEDRLIYQKDDESETEIIITENTSEEAEALAVAERIKTLIKDGIELGEEKIPISYEDIAILMGTRKAFSVFSDVFTKAGIPHICDGGEGFLKTRECDSLISLLRAIDNPCYDMHFAAAFVSPVFSFSPDDLVFLKSQNKKSLYEAAIDSGDESIASFALLLKRYRSYSFTLSAAELIKKIFYETNFIEIFASFPSGEVSRANLMRALEIAEKDTASPMSLREYLGRIDKYGERSVKLSAPSLSGAVRMMTIHGSKGLEFPVCFVCDCGRNHKTEKGEDPVLVHKTLGICMKVLDSERHISYTTAPLEAAKILKSNELLSERMRVLYVALTRAQKKLIITASLKNRDKSLSKLLGEIGSGAVAPSKVLSAKNDLEWVLMGICEPSDDARKSIIPSVGIKSDLSAKVVLAEPLEKEEKKSEIEAEVPPSDEILKILKDAAEFSYENSGIEKIPVRLSVSDIAKKHSEPQFISRPSFASMEDATAAERGTVVHKFMQYADYCLAQKSLETEIKRLLEAEFLSEKEAALLDKDKLTAFFRSSLYERISNADKVYREYSFMFSKNAGDIMDTLPKFKNEKVLIQGIADCIIIENGRFTVIDYKTDNVKTEDALIERYKGQLELYSEALEERLKLSQGERIIYSFKLGKEIKL
ncbi:MAG: helicase-exonuclease AddAB subunit AddA [Oscillospiraceae bacterium]|nr:helicase-exonuclease AddAB subunit AddA [Oscillospiraceae bacterium]